MRKILSAVCLVFSVALLQAQSVDFANVDRAGFEGLKSFDGNGYYMTILDASTSSKVKNNHIYVLDNNLKTTNDFVVTGTNYDDIDDLSFNGTNFMLIQSNSLKKTRTFSILDPSGKAIATKKFEDVKRRLLVKPAIIEPIKGSEEFVVINYIKDKKVGYSISRLSGSLEEKYNTEVIPEKKKLYPVDYIVTEDKMYVLEFKTPDFSDYFEYHVASFDLNTGALIGRNQLKSADDQSGYATFIKLNAKNEVITGGMYFNGNRTKAANSDGFFVSVIDASNKMTSSYTDWKSVQKQLKDKGTSTMWGGKTKTLLHDLTLNNDGTYTLVGSTFRRGDETKAGSKGGIGKFSMTSTGTDDVSNEAVTVSGFALFDFDAAGKFVTLRKIQAPESITVIKSTSDEDDKPYVGQAKGLRLANILNNYGYIPYRFTAKKGDKDYLVYVNQYSLKYSETLYFTDAKATTMDTTGVDITNSILKVSNDLQKKVTGKMGKLGKLKMKMDSMSSDDEKNEFYLRGSHDPYDFRAKERSTRVIQSNVDGKVLIYDFVPSDNDSAKGYFRKMNAALNGTLKIWYIDIP